MTAIANDHVVTFHYKLTGADGQVLDQSDGTPLPYLHGHSNIIPGLEQALAGKQAGDKLTVTVEPADAYGEYSEDMIQQVPEQMFQGVEGVQPGMQFQAETDDGVQVVTVKEVKDGVVTVDANHPLAGQRLTFDVEIVDVRPATETELQHGHAHGPDGHHHH